MKNIILTIAALLAIASCQQPADKSAALNEQARSEYNIPIRPGYEGKNPYWNRFSNKFMYAPAFDFEATEGAASYRYTIAQNVKENARSWSFTDKAPNRSLAPVWQQIEVGNVILTIEALDKEGNTIATVGERKFYRDSPFTGPYHDAVRGYKESALLALLYIHNMPAIQNWKNGPTPDMSYELNTYPCKITASITSDHLDLRHNNTLNALFMDLHVQNMAFSTLAGTGQKYTYNQP